MMGLCDGVVDSDGLLVDSSPVAATATAAACAGASPIASSIPAWAFVGLPVKKFEAVVRPQAGRGSGAEAGTERLTLTMLRQIREKYRAGAAPGSLLARLQEAKGRRLHPHHGRKAP